MYYPYKHDIESRNGDFRGQKIVIIFLLFIKIIFIQIFMEILLN